MGFRREYLMRAPLSLAQLYSRAYNGKDARSRHDNAFYLCEALVKLAAAPLVACHIEETHKGQPRAPELDRLLASLALPSLGQWLALLRELSRHFGNRPDAAVHPLGHLWNQLTTPRRDRPALLALFRRIKNGVDGEPAGDQSCSVLQVLEALVQYRNAVFGHGGPRFESFFEKEMGPLLLPALGELLDEETMHLLGPRGSRLVYVTEIRNVADDRFEIGLRELVGFQSERLAALTLTAAQSQRLLPNRVCVLWPGRPLPLRLDPLVVYRESETAEELLFLNRDRNGKQVEYLSYTTGRTERDRSMAPALAAFLGQALDRGVCEADLKALAEHSPSETRPNETLLSPEGPGGQTLGDYELLAELGRGGMGIVYLARQQSLGRLVALKMLPAELAGDAVALARFRREVRHLAQCEHPNIVKVLSDGVLPDGRLYYTMEYIPGCDLEAVWKELGAENQNGSAGKFGQTTWSNAVHNASRKKRDQILKRTAPDLECGGLPPLSHLEYDSPIDYVRRVAAMIRDAALALEAVHQKQVVHRDVKPANLMLTADGSRVVLMDFGLAKGQSLALTASKQAGFLGTLRYAAPEQLAAAMMKVGPAADVRALGCVLWELLTRRRLFGDAADEAQLAARVMHQDVPRLRSVDAALDRDLEAIVSRATEREVNRRIASAGLLAEYLDLYLEGKPLPIRPPGARELIWRWARRRKELVGMAAALLLLVMTLATGAIWYQFREAALAADKAREQAELETWEKELHKEMGDALAEGEGLHEELLRRLANPSKVHLLLSDIDDWKSLVKDVRKSWKHANSLATGNESSLTPIHLQRLAALKVQSEADEDNYLLGQELDIIRLKAATFAGRLLDIEPAAGEYATVFDRLNLSVPHGDLADLTANLSKSPLRLVLVAALDHWACGAPLTKEKAHLTLVPRLMELARRVDPDPWRDQVRAAVAAHDTVRLLELAKQANLMEQSPQVLLLLAWNLPNQGTARADLLGRALAFHPSDFWLHFELGNIANDPREKVGCYRAALAVRPTSSAAHFNLGVALEANGELDGAIAHYTKAVALCPKLAAAVPESQRQAWQQFSAHLDAMLDNAQHQMSAGKPK